MIEGKLCEGFTLYFNITMIWVIIFDTNSTHIFSLTYWTKICQKKRKYVTSINEKVWISLAYISLYIPYRFINQMVSPLNLYIQNNFVIKFLKFLYNIPIGSSKPPWQKILYPNEWCNLHVSGNYWVLTHEIQDKTLTR